MRTVLAAAGAAAALAVTAPGAVAAADSVYAGTCSVNVVPGPQDTHTGTLSAAVLVWSAMTPMDNPVSAVVTCTVLVNGVTVDGFSASGTTLISHAQPTVYVATPTDTVQVCTTIDYTSNATPTVPC